MKIGQLLALALLGFGANSSAIAVLIPYGIQTNVTQETVDSWGWTECHRSSSRSNGTESTNLDQCSDEDYLMTGAWDASLGTFGVIGAGDTAIVNAFTHLDYSADNTNADLDNWSNGLNWYRTQGRGSWGFTTISQTALNTADLLLFNGANHYGASTVETANNLASGLSWHVNNGSTFGNGWAYNPDGNSWTNTYDYGDQRVFWKTSVVAEIPEPASAALMLAGLAAFGLRKRSQNV